MPEGRVQRTEGRRQIAFVFLVLFLSACSTPEKLTLKPQQYSDLSGWDVVDHTGAIKAFQHSCNAMLKRSSDADMGLRMGQAKEWEPACEAAQEFNLKTADRMEASRQFFENYFTPLKSISSKRPDGLLTGYYEMELNGSRKKTAKYRYPIYRKPPEHLRTLTRAEIDEGGLAHRGLELVWVDDPVRLFFLHIQGSGIIHLGKNASVRVGYDGQNGQGYKALGRWLIDEGYMEQEDVNAPSIKAWLYNNPKLAMKAMQSNPSFIYFRFRDEVPHAQGPIGAQSVPLTPLHSLAIDKRFYGYGMPMWVETTLPEYENQPERMFHQLFIAQDTGGAIRGAIRGDVFFGRGAYAEKLAGYMKQRGNLWVLLPKSVAEKYVEER